jgi:hypothetical protein
MTNLDFTATKWHAVSVREGFRVDRPAGFEISPDNLNPARPTAGINGADPFVIAMASDGGPHWIVVTDEHAGSHENRKIPFVCNAERIRCLTFQQMMLAEGWQFR